MRPSGKVIAPFGLVLGLILAPLVTAPVLGADEPGEEAVKQKRYQAIQEGAKHLLKAKQALEKGKDKFKGHRVRAVKQINTALGELDKAVKFADKTDKPGEKRKPLFDADLGKLAAGQSEYPAIAAGAKQVIDAGKALDKGLDKFGGHRVGALKALNRALEELEKAVKDAK
jgi:hypothetical protein